MTRAGRVRPLPIAAMQSEDATFETFNSFIGGVLLVMRPHGVDRGDDREVGWNLTWQEVRGLVSLLRETVDDPSEGDVQGGDDENTGA